MDAHPISISAAYHHTSWQLPGDDLEPIAVTNLKFELIRFGQSLNVAKEHIPRVDEIEEFVKVVGELKKGGRLGHDRFVKLINEDNKVSNQSIQRVCYFFASNGYLIWHGKNSNDFTYVVLEKLEKLANAIAECRDSRHTNTTANKREDPPQPDSTDHRPTQKLKKRRKE